MISADELPAPSSLPDTLPLKTFEPDEVFSRVHRSARDPIFFGPPRGPPAGQAF